MDIYASWLPERFYYLVHLLLWMGSIIGLQWLAFARILRPNLRVILGTTALLGTYLILTDVVAIHFGVWFFDKEKLLGFNPLGVPIEEWLFFYLTVALCVQSFVLFLPERLRFSNSETVRSA